MENRDFFRSSDFVEEESGVAEAGQEDDAEDQQGERQTDLETARQVDPLGADIVIRLRAQPDPVVRQPHRSRGGLVQVRDLVEFGRIGLFDYRGLE